MNTNAIKFKTREEWLVAAGEELKPIFKAAGFNMIPDNIRVSCSWPTKSPRKRIGECCSPEMTEDKSHQISVSPVVGDAVQVLEVQVHEMLHVIVGVKNGHKKPFKQGMKKIGLEGKAKATYAGDALRSKLQEIADKLGEYPHSPMKLPPRIKKDREPTKVKYMSPQDPEFFIWIKKDQLERVGAPICPISMQKMIPEDELNIDEVDDMSSAASE